MAYILRNIGEAQNVPYFTFECDDVEDLPLIDVSRAVMGSRCYVINTGNWYALNSKKQWKVMPASATGSGSGSGSGSGDSGGASDDDIIYEGGMEV